MQVSQAKENGACEIVLDIEKLLVSRF